MEFQWWVLFVGLFEWWQVCGFVSVVDLASVGLFRLSVCFDGGGSVLMVVGLFHLWV